MCKKKFNKITTFVMGGPSFSTSDDSRSMKNEIVIDIPDTPSMGPDSMNDNSRVI